MTKEEILHLGALSRIHLSEDEVLKFNTEIDAILDYVGAVDRIAADASSDHKVGSLHNVFREDEITNEPGSYTADITAEFPAKEGAHLKVKKILNPDS